MEHSYILALLNVFLLPVIGVVGFVLKQITSKLEGTMSKEEIRQTIDDKLEPVKVEYGYVHTRLANIEAQVALILHELRHDRQKKEGPNSYSSRGDFDKK